MALLRSLSLILILSGLGLLVLIFSPVVLQEINYDTTRLKQETKQVASDPKQLEQLKAIQPELTKTFIIPDNFEFSLVIPKIGVNSRVFPNIDSGNPTQYLPVLKKGVAHALNSSLPSDPGPVFIFAHSTDTFYNIGRYNAVFFLLRKLEPGDEIYVFYRNRKYLYQISSKQVVDPEEVPRIVNQTTSNTLILQTCSPPGTTINRLLVFAQPK